MLRMPHSLLHIPRELRDEIITFVLYSPRQVPDRPYYPTNRCQLHDLNYTSLYREYVKYEMEPEWTIPAAHALLLVNHRIAAETRAILSRYRVPFCLDVMIVRESDFCPTWLAVPIPSTSIGELKINFRVFGTAISARKHQGMFMGTPSHNGNPPRFANEFYSLVERTLKRDLFFPSSKSLALLTKTAGFQQYYGAEKMGEEESLSKIRSIVPTGDKIRVYDKEILSKIFNARKTLGGEFADRKIVIDTLILDCETPSTWQGQRVARSEVTFDEWKTEAYYISESSSNAMATPTAVPRG